MIGLLVLATGCGSMAREPVSVLSPVARQAEIGALERFSVTGKLGIWSETQALSSRFSWQQNGRESTVVLSAPLGLGQWRLSDSDADGAALRRGNEPAWRDASLDALVQRALDLDSPVPVSQLRFWLKGAVGSGRAPVFDEFGRLTSLRYVDSRGARWQMSVLQYTRIDTVELPSLILAKGNVADSNGDVEAFRLRLVLDEWRLSDSTVPLPEGESTDSQPSDSGPKRLSIPGR